MPRKRGAIEKTCCSEKPYNRISIIQSESLTNLSPRFKNDIVSDLLSTQMKQSKYNAEGFHDSISSAKASLEDLNPENSTQLILAAQILSVHKAHQTMLMQAINETRPDHMQSYINLSVKLSNVLNQQIALMHKLKEGNQQKVVIEHVSINGGQAVVGTVNTGNTPGKGKI